MNWQRYALIIIVFYRLSPLNILIANAMPTSTNPQAEVSLKIQENLIVQQVVILKYTELLMYETMKFDMINSFLSGKVTALIQAEKDIYDYQINVVNHLSEVVIAEASKHAKTRYVNMEINQNTGEPFRLNASKWNRLVKDLIYVQRDFNLDHNPSFANWKTANLSLRTPHKRESILKLIEAILAVQKLNATELRLLEAIKHQQIMELANVISNNIATYVNTVMSSGLYSVSHTPIFWNNQATKLLEKLRHNEVTEQTTLGQHSLQIAEQNQYEHMIKTTVQDIEETYKNSPITIVERMTIPFTIKSNVTEQDDLHIIKIPVSFFWRLLGFSKKKRIPTRLLHEFYYATADMFNNIFNMCDNCMQHPLLNDKFHEIYVNNDSVKWKYLSSDIFPFEKPVYHY